MNARFSRRKLMHAAGAAALPFSVSAAAGPEAAASATMSAARQNGTEIPKICLEIGQAASRRAREPRPERAG